VQKIAATDWTGMGAWVDTDANAVALIRDLPPSLPAPPPSFLTGTDHTTVLATLVPQHDAGGPDTPSRCPSGGD
jgi:hypothetical protein